MKLITSMFVASALAIALITSTATASDPASTAANIATDSQSNTICPISGKAVDPAVTYVYEGRTWAFAEAASRAEFKQTRENSLYHKLGGRPAIDAAVEAFYVKVLADDRVKHFFDDINMNAQRRRQKDFLSFALGGPLPWTGKDMRTAHEDLTIEESHFNAIAENLVATLKDLKISQDLIDQVVAIVVTVKDDVLNRPKKAQ